MRLRVPVRGDIVVFDCCSIYMRLLSYYTAVSQCHFTALYEALYEASGVSEAHVIACMHARPFLG